MGCAASVHSTDSFIESSDFLFSYCIGKGGFGKVYSCMHLASQEWLAVKEQKLSEVLSHKNGLSLITAELHALRVIGTHPFIVGLHFAFYDATSCYLALDLCCGGDLRYHMKKFLFGETRVAFLVMCVSSAIQHLHDHGVIHRDIKPENIIFNDRGYPLVTDFGVAFIHPTAGFDPQQATESDLDKKYPKFQCDMSSGTKQYLAPEVFTSLHFHGPAVDYWSLGVMAYELLFGKRPFQRHCPSNLIAFAENDYVISTDNLPVNAESSKPLRASSSSGLLLSASVVTVDCSESPSPSPPISPSSQSPLPSPQSLSTTTSLLPHFLQTRIPRSSTLHGDVSESCRSVLSALLEVRPTCRHNYHSLRQDKWFKEKDFEWDEVERVLIESPFRPDLKQVSLDICTRYMFETEDDICVARHTMSSSQLTKLDDTMNRFQYVSPEFIKYVPQEYLKKLSLSLTPFKGEIPTAMDNRSGTGIINVNESDNGNGSGSGNGGDCPGPGQGQGQDKSSRSNGSSPVVDFRHELL